MKSNDSQVKQYIFARSLGMVYFWGAVSVPYLVYRGFSILEVFTLLGIYSLLVVIFEFPTGVIGDVYGHKFSINLANALGALSMIILAQKWPLPVYYLCTILMGLSSALVSGSDIALLKTVSNNFKKDLATLQMLENIFLSVSVSIAGFFAKYSLSLPLYLTAVAWIISGIMTQLVQTPYKRHPEASSNVFKQAFNSLSVVMGNLPLVAVLLYAMVNDGYQFDVKTLINSSVPKLSLDIQWIGLIVGLSYISRAVGFKLVNVVGNIRTKYFYLSAILTFSLIILIKPGYVSLIILSLLNILLAIIHNRTEVAVNDLIGDHVRASVLSFKNLLVRLASALYLFLGGYILDLYDLRILMAITVPLYGAAGLGYVYLNKRYISKSQNEK